MIGSLLSGGSGGIGLTGGASGDATAGADANNQLNTGFGGLGGFAVGDYVSRGSTNQKTTPLNKWLMIGGAVLVAFWILKKQK